MTDRKTHTQEIHVPYPDASPINLEIVVGAPGQVHARRTRMEGFVGGTVEYDRELWAPKVEQRAGKVRISQAERLESHMDFSLDFVNRWDLLIGDQKPFGMEVRCGVNRGRWELGGLPLTDLRIETGVSENVFTFDSPNPASMRSLELRCGVASVEMEGLLNTGAERIDVKGGVGSVTLRFTGQSPKQNTRVKIEGGVGQFTIAVGEMVPARAIITGLVGVTPRGGFRQTAGGSFFGGSYENATYASASGPRLELDITAGISGISLETVPR